MTAYDKKNGHSYIFLGSKAQRRTGKALHVGQFSCTERERERSRVKNKNPQVISTWCFTLSGMFCLKRTSWCCTVSSRLW